MVGKVKARAVTVGLGFEGLINFLLMILVRPLNNLR